MAKNKQQPGRVKSALLNWLGVPISLTTGEFWREWYGTSSSGKVVTADKVIRLSAVWACVRLLSESVSTLPLKIYERQADGSRKLAQNNPAYQILCRRPNPEMTPSRFMLMIVASICLRGNAFVEKLYIGSKLVSLVPLLPQNMVVKRLDSGKLQYTYTENSVKRIIPVDRMMHIRGFGLDGVCGMMPTMAGDDIQIGRGAFLMIHNCWVYAMGNRHDFAELAQSLEPFDTAMADIYAARSGLDIAAVQKLMDGESYIGGSDAVAKGLADSLLSADAVSDGDESPAAALRKLDALLAKTNTPRAERRKLIKALSGGMPGAVTTKDGTPGAAEDIKPETLNSLESALAALVK